MENPDALRISAPLLLRLPLLSAPTIANWLQPVLTRHNLVLNLALSHGTNIQSDADMKFLFTFLPGTILHIYTNTIPTQRGTIQPLTCRFTTLNQDSFMIVVVDQIIITRGQGDDQQSTRYYAIIFTFGHVDAVGLLNTYFGTTQQVGYEIPENSMLRNPLDSLKMYAAESLDEYKPGLVLGNNEELILVARSARLDIPTKVASIMYHFFAHTQDRLSEECKVMSIDQARADSLVAATEIRYATELEKEEAIKCMIALFTLGFSYTRAENVGRHIAKRISAVNAMMFGQPILIDTVKKWIGKFHLTTMTSSPWVDYMLQLLICVKTNRDVNAMADEIDFIDPGDLATLVHIPFFEAKILEQARMVYRFYHNKSIRFALEFLEALSDYSEFSNANLEAEKIRLNALRDQLMTKPYIGLQKEIPLRFRIANFPMLCYGGVLYHHKMLPTEFEKKEFTKYETTSIITHLNANAKVLIETIVDILDCRTVKALMGAVMIQDEERSEQLMTKLTEDEKKELYYAIRRKLTRDGLPNAHGGAWYSLQHERRLNVDISANITRGQQLLQKYLSDTVANYNTRYSTIDNTQERLRQISILTDFQDKVTRAMRVQGEFRRNFGKVQYFKSHALLSDIINYFEGICDIITAGPVANLTITPYNLQAAIETIQRNRLAHIAVALAVPVAKPKAEQGPPNNPHILP